MAEVFPADAQRRLMLLGVGAFIFVHLVRPWFLAASMSGSNNFASDLALIPTILSSTHQGTLWCINSCALVVLLAGALMKARSNRAASWIVCAALAVIAFTKAASGMQPMMAISHSWSSLSSCISSRPRYGRAPCWSAGFLVVPRLARHAVPANLLSFGNRLSAVVTWALAALLISGIYTSDRELNNTLSALWTSAWGKVLIVKVSFVFIAIALGASSRFFCLQRPAGREDGRATLMARLLLTEAIVMICILCLSGLLGNTAPAMSTSMSM